MRTEGRIQIGSWVMKHHGIGWVWGRARLRVIRGRVSEALLAPHHFTADEPPPGVLFSAWLRRRRLDLGMTQKHLSELSGVSRRALQNIEAGRSDPKLSTLAPLIQELTR